MAKILLVEDNIDLRMLMGMAIESEGFEVDYAVHGQEALEKLKSPDLPVIILLDLMMPVMTGQEFLSHFEKDARLSSIPVIICSALENGGDLGHRFLKKPIEFNVLAEAVRSYK